MDPFQIALDTSTSRSTVCLMQGERVWHEWTSSEGIRHHETLLIGVDACLTAAQLKVRDIGFFSVGVGPGMFTGLRIGITSAKFLADAYQKPCVPVSSLVALVYQAKSTGRIWALSDAKSNRVYALPSSRKELEPRFDSPAEEEVAITPDEVAKQMQAGDFLIGEGAALYQNLWPTTVTIAAPEENILRASSVGAIGRLRYQLALTCTAVELQPKYLKTGQPHL